MSKAALNFLQNQIEKGGKNAYCALLILGAIERKNVALLKKFNMQTIDHILSQQKGNQQSA